MTIGFVTVWLLIAGLIGGNEYPSQQASSAESKASVASETVVEPSRPTPIEAVNAIVPLHAQASAVEAIQPAQQADITGSATPPDDVSSGIVWVEDDDNFDSWAK